MIETTICLPLLGNPPEKVLLAHKKRGFGVGKITGVGGKIKAGESAPESAVRELAEEIGIAVRPAALYPRGEIDFLFPYKPSWNMRSQLFVVQEWLGKPSESDEVAPNFYSFEQIPFAQMWADAQYWLPPVLAGQSIRAKFVFGEDNETIMEQSIQIESNPAETERPRVQIRYCTQCRWLLRAAWMAQELLSTFEAELGEVALAPGSGGIFEVRINEELIWSRSDHGRFPDIKELKQLVRNRVAPERSLGHSDRAQNVQSSGL